MSAILQILELDHLEEYDKKIDNAYKEIERKKTLSKVTKEIHRKKAIKLAEFENSELRYKTNAYLVRNKIKGNAYREIALEIKKSNPIYTEYFNKRRKLNIQYNVQDKLIFESFITEFTLHVTQNLKHPIKAVKKYIKNSLPNDNIIVEIMSIDERKQEITNLIKSLLQFKTHSKRELSVKLQDIGYKVSAQTCFTIMNEIIETKKDWQKIKNIAKSIFCKNNNISIRKLQTKLNEKGYSISLGLCQKYLKEFNNTKNVRNDNYYINNSKIPSESKIWQSSSNIMTLSMPLKKVAAL